jgi:hypothetical protein
VGQSACDEQICVSPAAHEGTGRAAASPVPASALPLSQTTAVPSESLRSVASQPEIAAGTPLLLPPWRQQAAPTWPFAVQSATWRQEMGIGLVPLLQVVPIALHSSAAKPPLLLAVSPPRQQRLPVEQYRSPPSAPSPQKTVPPALGAWTVGSLQLLPLLLPLLELPLLEPLLLLPLLELPLLEPPLLLEPLLLEPASSLPLPPPLLLLLHATIALAKPTATVPQTKAIVRTFIVGSPSLSPKLCGRTRVVRAST